MKMDILLQNQGQLTPMSQAYLHVVMWWITHTDKQSLQQERVAWQQLMQRDGWMRIFIGKQLHRITSLRINVFLLIE